MSFIDDLSELFTDTATHAVLSTRDGFGKPTYGSGTAYSGRLVTKNKLVRDQQGDDVVSTAHFWFQGAPDVGPDDQITLSDGATPPIISVERFQDDVGTSHTKVYFR